MVDFVPHSFFRRVTAVMKRIRYIEELNYFNGIACLLVILIHVLSLGVVSEARTWQGFCVFLPWRISQFVVPAFLFSGAVKMISDFFRILPEEGAAEAQKRLPPAVCRVLELPAGTLPDDSSALRGLFFLSIMRPIGRQDCCSRPGMR